MFQNLLVDFLVQNLLFSLIELNAKWFPANSLKKASVYLNVLEEDGVGFDQQLVELLGDHTHIGVSRFGCSQLDEVSPFTDVGGHHDLGLQAVGQDRAGILGTATDGQQIEVSQLCSQASLFPNIVTSCSYSGRWMLRSESKPSG